MILYSKRLWGEFQGSPIPIFVALSCGATSRGLCNHLLWYCGLADLLNHQMDARISFPMPPNPYSIYSFQDNINDIRCDIMIKRGCGATSRGLRRPPPVELGSYRSLELSNECQNKFSHAPKPLYTHFHVPMNWITCKNPRLIGKYHILRISSPKGGLNTNKWGHIALEWPEMNSLAQI